jgi:WG containing repeat
MKISSQYYQVSLATILATILGCGSKSSPSNSPISNGPPSINNTPAKMEAANSREVKVDEPNESGFAKISIRDGDIYQEGIVDAQGNEVVQPRSRMGVNDITGNLALLLVENKFLFVPLDQGFVSSKDLDEVNGFQYAEPYSCGLALVSVDDRRFYLDANFEKAFDMDFEFAESFHHDRAWVKADDRHRIIDTQGKTVAELNYDQVSPQSPRCWQVIKIENKKYLSGFVDLDGKLVTELIYDEVGYYDPDVKRIRVGVNDRYGFLDENAKVVIPVKYEYAEPFDRGKARVKLDGRVFLSIQTEWKSPSSTNEE